MWRTDDGRSVSIERAARWAEALGYPPAYFVRLVAQAAIDAVGVKPKVVGVDAA